MSSTELAVLPSAAERMRERTLDAAQPHDDVRPRLHEARRLARVLAGRRVNRRVRPRALDAIGDMVDEPQQRRRRAALLVLDGLAFCARALAVPVVLRRGDDGPRRCALELLQHALRDDVHHVGIGQAELRVVVRPLACDLGEILRVRREILLRRHQRIERVDKALADDLAAALLIEPCGVTVGLVTDGPVGVVAVERERLAVFQRGRLAVADRLDGERFLLRDAADLSCGLDESGFPP